MNIGTVLSVLALLVAISAAYLAYTRSRLNVSNTTTGATDISIPENAAVYNNIVGIKGLNAAFNTPYIHCVSNKAINANGQVPADGWTVQTANQLYTTNLTTTAGASYAAVYVTASGMYSAFVTTDNAKNCSSVCLYMNPPASGGVFSSANPLMWCQSAPATSIKITNTNLLMPQANSQIALNATFWADAGSTVYPLFYGSSAPSLGTNVTFTMAHVATKEARINITV